MIAWWPSVFSAPPDMYDNREELRSSFDEFIETTTDLDAALVSATAGCLDGSAERGEIDDVARVAIGRSIFLSLFDGPISPKGFQFALDTTVLGISFWHDLVDHISSRALDEANEEWRAWLGRIPERTEEFAEYTSARAHLAAWVKAERVGRPEDAFGGDSSFYPLASELRARLEVLMMWDTDSYLEAIDKVSSLFLQKAILDETLVHQDTKVIKAGLWHAKSVFDDKRWTGETTALVFLEKAFDYANALHYALETSCSDDVSEPQQVEEVENSEIPTWFQECFEIVLERQDGVRLILVMAVEYLRRLVRETRRRRPDQWSAIGSALEVATKLLLSRGYGFGKILDAFPTETNKVVNLTDADPSNDHSVLPIIVAAMVANMRGAAATDEEEPADLRQGWRKYADLLGIQNSEIVSHTNPQSSPPHLFHTYIGWLLHAFDSPSKEWSASWTRLYSQRELARFPNNDHALSGSIHLLRTGTDALDTVDHENETEVEEGRALWKNLVDSASTLHFGRFSRIHDGSRLDLVRLFGFAGRVFGDDWRQRVRVYADLFLADDMLAIMVAYAFVVGDVGSPDEVSDLFETIGIDIGAAIEGVEEWRALWPGQQRRIDLEVVKRTLFP